MVVDAGGNGALHLAAPLPSEAAAWKHALYQAATNCGPALDQQQLNQDNVPVILDKCINFVYAHGKYPEMIDKISRKEMSTYLHFYFLFFLNIFFKLDYRNNLVLYLFL